MKQNETKKNPRAAISPDLVERAKAGDQNAFTDLYQQTSTELYRTIRAMVKDEDLVWDIHQDTYLRAFRSLDKLKSNQAFLSWLRQIAVNVTATKMAKRVPLTFTELSDEDSEMPELPDERVEIQPELALDQKETSRLVHEIMAGLPEQQLMILGMRYYEDLSVKEIADLLHLSQGTVKTQLFRGRKKVEAEVRALEQQGVKLYGLTPLAFVFTLLHRAEPAKAMQTKMMSCVLEKTAELGGKAVSITAKPMGTSFFLTTAGKIAGAALGIALAGGVFFGAKSLLNAGASNGGDYQPTASSYVRLEATDSTAETVTALRETEESVNPSETLGTTETAATAQTAEATQEPTKPTETTKPAEPTKPSEQPTTPSKSNEAPAFQVPAQFAYLCASNAAWDTLILKNDRWVDLRIHFYENGSLWLQEGAAFSEFNVDYDGLWQVGDNNQLQLTLWDSPYSVWDRPDDYYPSAANMPEKTNSVSYSVTRTERGITLRKLSEQALSDTVEDQTVLEFFDAQHKTPTLSLDELRQMVGRAASEDLGSFLSRDIASLRFCGIAKRDDHGMGLLKRAGKLTISEAELQALQQSGSTVLNGTTYVYLTAEELMEQYGIDFGVESPYGLIYQKGESVGSTVKKIEKIADGRYAFWYGVGGLTTWIEDDVSYYWVLVDLNTTVAIYFSDEETTLGEYGTIPSSTLAYPEFDGETGEFYIGVDPR